MLTWVVLAFRPWIQDPHRMDEIRRQRFLLLRACESSLVLRQSSPSAFDGLVRFFRNCKSTIKKGKIHFMTYYIMTPGQPLRL